MQLVLQWCTFYTFSSDGSLRGDIEGLFHEYGHAVRENLWIDPSRYFRWRKLGGAHESVSAPCSSEYVAFDEGHSDMFASMLLQYARSKMQKLYDIPLPKPEMYTSQEFKGIDSKKFLSKVVEIISKKGYSIENVDSIIILQKPKIAGYISQMKKILAEAMKIETDDISVKATTTEKLGFTGREEGVAAQAVVLLVK